MDRLGWGNKSNTDGMGLRIDILKHRIYFQKFGRVRTLGITLEYRLFMQ